MVLFEECSEIGFDGHKDMLIIYWDPQKEGGTIHDLHDNFLSSPNRQTSRVADEVRMILHGS